MVYPDGHTFQIPRKVIEDMGSDTLKAFLERVFEDSSLAAALSTE